MINLTEHFNSPITEEDNRFIEKVLKEINKEAENEFSFNDGLILLEIKNRILKKLTNEERNLQSDIPREKVLNLIDDELKELADENKRFNDKKVDILKFIQYLLSIKEMK